MSDTLGEARCEAVGARLGTYEAFKVAAHHKSGGKGRGHTKKTQKRKSKKETQKERVKCKNWHTKC